MKRTRIVAVAAWAAAYLCSIVEVQAGSSSCSPIQRANVVHCALEGSLTAKAERQNLEITDARRETARPVLPANPVLQVSAAQRTTTSVAPVVNWYVTLSQEIEIGGQRSARLRAADAEHEAQEKLITKTDRDVAAAAWRAYFEALAAKEEVRLAERLEMLTGRVATATRAAADKGVASGVDADVAEAAHLRATRERISAMQHEKTANAHLMMQVGLEPTANIAVEGELIPLADVEAFAAKQSAESIEERPEIQALEATGRAYDARASLFRRSRIPNPTVGVFVQNDGFNERVIGAQLSLPIPLPQPIGRTYAGEIAEAEASSRRTKTELEKVRRDIRLNLTQALAAFTAAKAQYDLYTTERSARTNQSLQAIASEIEAGRLAIRDAIVSQQALVEILQLALETRKNLALASVDLAVASGYALERGTP